MQLSYTAPQDPQLDQQLDTFLSFWGKRADELVLVRVLANPIGKGEADVGVARNGADLMRLIRTAARDRYVALDGSPRIYQGTYARLCHTAAPRDWLDRGRPKLTAATAASYPGFVVDIDAVKECGDCSNEAELQETLRVADEILGWIDSIIGLDRSYALPVMSGNGTQLNIRGTLDMHEAGLARTLLLRMKSRWPAVDDAGWMLSVGPAVPGTRKCKGTATEDRPHRMVQILGTREGDRRLSADDLKRLIEALPEVANEVVVTRQWGRAYDPFSAVAELPIEDALEKLFNERSICPVCKSTDGAVAVIAPNLVTCQHRHSCPAASTGRTGFNAVHAYGTVLGYGWGPYSAEQRLEIVDAAQMDGWELVWDDGEEPDCEELVTELKPQVDALLTALTQPEPDRHCTILPSEPWRLNVKGPARVADHVMQAIKRSFCPDWANDRTLVLCGRLYVYHQGLGIWVTISPTPDIDRVHRIIDDQVKGPGIWVPEKAGMKAWEPPTKPVIDSLDHTLPQPHFFREGRVGLACRDGFLELVGLRWVPRPHHPDNRARGRVNKTCAAVLRDIKSGAANASAKALREILVKTLQRDDETVDGLSMVFLEQMGSVACRMRPELRTAIFLHGAPDTGKSSLLRVARAMARYLGLTVTGSSLSALNGDFPDESLLGSDINIVEEEGAFGGRGVATSRLKQIVEGSQWSFPRKNRGNVQVEFDLLWLSASNNEPTFAESTSAIAKRACIVQYPKQRVQVLDREMIPRFLDQHLDGIIAASLAGAARLSVTGRTVLDEKSDIMEHTRDVGRTQTLVEAWLETVDESVCDGTDTPLSDALQACNRWGEMHGYRQEAATNNPGRFGRALARQLTRKSRKSNGRTMVAVALPKFEPETSDDVSKL